LDSAYPRGTSRPGRCGGDRSGHEPDRHAG
jgi:hypothetical protein